MLDAKFQIKSLYFSWHVWTKHLTDYTFLLVKTRAFSASSDGASEYTTWTVVWRRSPRGRKDETRSRSARWRAPIVNKYVMSAGGQRVLQSTRMIDRVCQVLASRPANSAALPRTRNQLRARALLPSVVPSLPPHRILSPRWVTSSSKQATQRTITNNVKIYLNRRL